MTDYNIPFFKTFWPFLASARIIGIFPCKKVKNEDGSESLVVVNWKIRLLSFLIYACLVLTATCICIGIVINDIDNGTSIIGFFRALAASKGPTIDAYLDNWIGNVQFNPLLAPTP